MTYANADVLAFYQARPFNDHATLDEQIRDARCVDMHAICPTLVPRLRPGVRVLEVGCGVGWLACRAAELYGCDVTAIDFNPVAIERARGLAEAMGVAVEFHVADLFLYEPARRADVVIANGVLHHTNSCDMAMRRCMETFVDDAGDVVIGLYHRHGRAPLLEHFRQYAIQHPTEADLFAEYTRLHGWITEPTQAYSWFRDQVLHPCETHHTLREVVSIGAALGFTLVSTSLNRFCASASLGELYDQECLQEQIGRQRLRQGVFFPGFFTTHLRRR